MTFGQERVRLDFNPAAQGVPGSLSGELVDQIKRETAALIDLLRESNEDNCRDGRLIALAQTAYEEAAMWAVKAITS